MKKVVSLLCVLVLLLSLNVCAFASSGKQEQQTGTTIPSHITNISKINNDKGNHIGYRFYNTEHNIWYNIYLKDGHVHSYKSSADSPYSTGHIAFPGQNLDRLFPYFKDFAGLFNNSYDSTANVKMDNKNSSSPVEDLITDVKNSSNSVEDLITDVKNSSNNTACWVEIEKGISMLLSPSWLENETNEFDAKFTHSSNSKYIAIVLSDLEEYKSSKTIDDIFNTYVNKGYQENLVKMNINGISAIGVVQEDTYIVVLPKDTESFFQIRFLNFDKNDSTYLNYIEQMVKTISISN